ncbi:hypothetical protein BDF22DRAFT_685296 [Syncephalis plumigaleata]|nr:hypothetical protein BDF22DRAFT_685296 [Syncephalis plumigaleata]
MHLNLSIATAALLLLASTTSAASLGNFCLNLILVTLTSHCDTNQLPSLIAPVPNNDYPSNKWESAAGFDYIITRKLGAIGDVEYLEGQIAQGNMMGIVRSNVRPATFTCVLVKEKMTTQVPRIYQILGPEPKSATQNPADHVAHSIGGMWLAQHKYCYVSTKVCTKPYKQYYREIDNNQELSHTELRHLTDRPIDQITSAIKYLKSKGLAYNFSEDNVCFDNNNQLVLLRHGQARIVSKETITPAELNAINQSIHNIIWSLVYLGYTGNDDSEVVGYIERKYNAVKYSV